PQPAVLRFQIHGLSWCGFAGILVLAHPDSQGFFAQTELVRDAGDRPVRGVRIGLGVDDELDGTSLEFVGVFHWQERNSFFQSPCLYYPRGDSARADEVFLNGEGVDVAYNGVGKDTFDASPASIRPLAWFGAARRSWRRVRRCSSTVSSTAGSTSASAQHLLWPMLLTKEHIAHDTARFAGEPLRRQRHAQWGLRARSRASMCGRTVSQITVQS